MNKIIIDPGTNIPYGSFYIKGLVEKYGMRNIKFRSKSFEGLPPVGWNIRYIVKEKNHILKVFIHTSDTYHIDKDHYLWCDIYGHVNANFRHYPIKLFPKQVSLVPSFGIRCFNIYETLYYSIANFYMSFNDIRKWQFYDKEIKKMFKVLIKIQEDTFLIMSRIIYIEKILKIMKTIHVQGKDIYSF